MSSLPSLCIPRVFANITEERIRDVFEKLNIGDLSRVDIVKTADEKYNRVYVHFIKWNETEEAKQARKCVMDGDDFKVIYDGPWFWKVSAFRAAAAAAASNKPKIVFDDEKKRKRDTNTRSDSNRYQDKESNSSRYEDRKRNDSRYEDRRRSDSRNEDRKRNDNRYEDRRRSDNRNERPKPVSKKPEAKKEEAKKPKPEPESKETKPMQDENINCKVCTKVFVFSLRDQEFYKSKGFQTRPQRCRECAKARKNTDANPVLVNPRHLFQPRTPENSPPRQRPALLVPKSPDHPSPQRFLVPKSPDHQPPVEEKKKRVFIMEEEEEE
jgi:hypothetical protein